MGRTRRHRKRNYNRPYNNPKIDTPIIELLKWLNLKNLSTKIKEFSLSGRGIISKKVIMPGEEILALPLEAMITTEVINKSNISQMFSSTFQTTVSMSLWLIYERHLGNSSKYFQYLNILPSQFDCLFLCSRREKDALPDWIVKAIDDRLMEAQAGFDNAIAMLNRGVCNHCATTYSDIFTHEKYLWAWACVNTRCVYYEDEKIADSGGKETLGSIALAPYLDLFNHSNTANVEAKLDYQRRVYILKTNDRYKKYDEVFIKYGAFSNLRLLVEYGFMQNDDSQDVVEFKFDDVVKAAKSVDPYYGDISKLKYKFITYNNLNVNLSKSADEFSWNCRGLLYILVTRDDNLADLLSKTYSSTYSEKECELIEEVQQKMIELKKSELTTQLHVMQRIPLCSHSFTLAKELVTMYLRILTR